MSFFKLCARHSIYNNINLYYYLIIYYLIDSNKITHNSATIQISRKKRGWDITTAMAYYDNSRLMIHCLTVAEFYRVYMQCFFKSTNEQWMPIHVSQIYYLKCHFYDFPRHKNQEYVIPYLRNKPHFIWVYRRDNPCGMLGEHKKSLYITSWRRVIYKLFECFPNILSGLSCQ